MTEHKVGTQEEFRAARDELLKAEKELTRRSDELARKRRELPWVPVEKDYSFETEAGEKSLAELFDGRSQLIIYHFMFGPKYEAGCVVCSSIADGFNGSVPHLRGHDVNMICVSRAPIEKLSAYKKRMGWDFTWASSSESDFNFDFGQSQSEEAVQEMLKDWTPPSGVEYGAALSGTDPAGYLEEAPGLSAYALEDGAVYRTYATSARGLEFSMVYYAALDRTALGRNEPDNWLRRHDEYGAATATATG